MKSLLTFASLLIILCSCTKSSKDSSHVLAPLIVFSHNIHGEFAPCGCRKKPLGGIVQVAGYFAHLKKKYPKREILYFDTGDSLYPAGNIPKLFKESHDYSADQVYTMLSKVGVTATLPGDQDFSQGIEKYTSLVKKNKIPVLISNASKEFPIKSQKYMKFEFGSLVYYFLSVLDSSTLKYNQKSLVTNSEQSIKQTLEQIKVDHGKNHPAQQKMLFLLSHSGMSIDQDFAKKFPQINWIIGAHTQNFTQLPQLTPGSKTQIVQVLSRNHHIGLIDPLSLEQNYTPTELNDTFTQFDGNETWVKLFESMNKELKRIKEKELNAFGNE